MRLFPRDFSNCFSVLLAVKIILPRNQQFPRHFFFFSFLVFRFLSPPPVRFFCFFFFKRDRISSIHRMHRVSTSLSRKVVSSAIRTRTISFPLFSPTFHRLILESLQVFHDSNGIFDPASSISRRRYKRRFCISLIALSLYVGKVGIS